MTNFERAQPSTVRVLVVDDHQLIRDGIAAVLDLQPGVSVIATAANGLEAIEQAHALSPDVILMDVRMPVMDGVEATVAIRQQTPACQVVMLSIFDDDQHVIKALQAGASGYLLKDIAPAALAQAIQLAHLGLWQLDSAPAVRLIQATDRRDADPVYGSPVAPLDPSLTSRERQVLRLIAAGATNREIAAQLHVSEGTVKNHVSRILGQLGLRDRTQAAIYAHGRLGTANWSSPPSPANLSNSHT